MSKVRAAVVQAAPVFLDLEGTLGVMEARVAEAAGGGAGLVAFPETFLPGYPAWLDVCPGAALWDHPGAKDLYARLLENSVTVPGAAHERLAAMAAGNGVVLVVGVHERKGRSLHNALLVYDADGSLVVHHRKLVPTYTEKLLWAPGDGAGLDSAETRAGNVGGLICWEHWMPLARQILHESGERIHVAVWPWVKEMHLVASRHYAFEGRTFVLAAGGLLRAGDLPDSMPLPEDGSIGPDDLLLRGGSAIFGPGGETLAGPVLDEETILFADLDLADADRESLTLDVGGHYARPDVFDLKVDRNRR